jgi:hypothetical protein
VAHPVRFDGANVALQPPEGAENVEPMPVFRNGISCTSCWALSPEEVVEVARTGRIFVTVMAGPTQPPIFVAGEENTRELLADYGTWKR